MLPALLWLAMGTAAAVLTGIRAQVAMAGGYPGAAWAAVGIGLLVTGAILAFVVSIVFTFRSWWLTGVLLLIVPALVAVGGVMGIRRAPAARFAGADVASEWGALHPSLRLVVRVAAAADWDLRVTDIVLPPRPELAPPDTTEYELPPEVEARPPTDAEFAAGPPGSAAYDAEPDAAAHVAVHGYSRAVNLRSTPAGPLHTWLRDGLFLMMGVHAVRQDGKPQELHVSLPD